MVSTIPSAVSGLTKQSAPSAGVVPGGNTRHCTALMQRYCAYIAPPRIAAVFPHQRLCCRRRTRLDDHAGRFVPDW